MYELDIPNATGFGEDDSESGLDMFWLCIYCLSFLMFSYMAYRGGKKAISAAKSNNTLELDDESAEVIAGFLQGYMHTFHTSKKMLEFPTDEAAIIAAGPHKTGGVDAFSLASNMEGKMPRFFATNTFFDTPVVGGTIKRMMNKFKVIVVDFSKEAEGKVNARQAVLEAGNKALAERGRVALFPQGNFAYINKEPPIVYTGAAKLAIENNLPIQVVRLDGYKSLENWLIPVCVRNNGLFRALGTLFLRNDIKTNLCWVIDVHLREGNKLLSKEEKIRLINAEMYAFFRHTEELTPEQIDKIKDQVKAGSHLAVWDNKFGQYLLTKKLKILVSEQDEILKGIAKSERTQEIEEDTDRRLMPA